MWNKITLGLGLSLLALSYANSEDTLTITTYYPSPYGEYNQLQTNRLAVGDTNGNNSLDVGDQPNRDGDIRLKSQAGDPAFWPAGTPGQFSYSSTKDDLYHYNGSKWVASSGGGPGNWTCRLVASGTLGQCRCTPPEKIFSPVCQYPVATMSTAAAVGYPWDYGGGVFGVECNSTASSCWGLCCK